MKFLVLCIFYLFELFHVINNIAQADFLTFKQKCVSSKKKKKSIKVV